jgi:Flp pilus assembly protein TadD
MKARTARGVVALACLLVLGGCGTSSNIADALGSSSAAPESVGSPSEDDPATTGSLSRTEDSQAEAAAAAPAGGDTRRELDLGKKHFGNGNFSAAERHFRRATQRDPARLEAWLGLAACHDNLKRFDLADQAYERATRIAGSSAEILNNWGYSYMLRGDYARAREILLKARAQDPKNPYVKNNIELLEASVQKKRSVH